MAQGKPRDPHKEQHWRQLIDQWQRSGLSVRAFCRRQHLAAPSFYAWRRTLRQRDGRARPATAPVTFLPVHVRADDTDRDGPPPLELVLANGRRLRIPPGYDDAHLRQLLRALEDAPC
jgi:transposase-like protein